MCTAFYSSALQLACGKTGNATHHPSLHEVGRPAQFSGGSVPAAPERNARAALASNSGSRERPQYAALSHRTMSTRYQWVPKCGWAGQSNCVRPNSAIAHSGLFAIMLHDTCAFEAECMACAAWHARETMWSLIIGYQCSRLHGILMSNARPLLSSPCSPDRLYSMSYA